MGYLPKELLQKTYLTLSELTSDHKQGQTQIVSALRYMIALDMFYKANGRDCNLNNQNDRDEFTSNIRSVVIVSGDYYTVDFYSKIKEMSDCGVGSNFYSVGIVRSSKIDPLQIFDYPTRGNSPLFKIQNNTLIRESNYTKNIQSYLPTEQLKAAFILWLLRDIPIERLSFGSIKHCLNEILTTDTVTNILPLENILNDFYQNYELTKEKYHLSPRDLLYMLNDDNTTNGIVANEEGVIGTNVHSINDTYRPFITAIKSKPFLLLAGISGTGKSRIVRELARACWDTESDEYRAHKPRNFEIIQVKPNWHDSSDLIGYVSRIDGVRYVVGPFLRFMVRAMQEPDIPYFLCLDEMNLAPVEQYFAEFLSVIESRKVQEDGSIATDPIVDYSNTEEYYSLIQQLFPNDETLRASFLTEHSGRRLTIPQNLIVIGTVNMDETTFSFSRKVLDRAMTIEMNDVDLNGGLTNRYEPIGKLDATNLIATAVEGVDVYTEHKEVCDKAIAYLQQVNNILDRTPFKIAYRTRNETLLYVVNNLPYNVTPDGLVLSDDFVIARALDEITCMKILSRIDGDETKVTTLFLDQLETTLRQALQDICPLLFECDSFNYTSISLTKLIEMRNRLSSGYTSFWS